MFKPNETTCSKNEYFFSGGDNRKQQHKLYNECYKIATKEQK